MTSDADFLLQIIQTCNQRGSNIYVNYLPVCGFGGTRNTGTGNQCCQSVIMYYPIGLRLYSSPHMFVLLLQTVNYTLMVFIFSCSITLLNTDCFVAVTFKLESVGGWRMLRGNRILARKFNLRQRLQVFVLSIN